MFDADGFRLGFPFLEHIFLEENQTKRYLKISHELVQTCVAQKVEYPPTINNFNFKIKVDAWLYLLLEFLRVYILSIKNAFQFVHKGTKVIAANRSISHDFMCVKV